MLAFLIAIFLSCIALATGSLNVNPIDQELSTSKNSNVMSGSSAAGVNTSFDMDEAKSSSYAQNMLTYSNALTNYATTNQAFAGVIPSGSISLPSWFVDMGFTNYMKGGKVYVYNSNPSLLNVASVSLSLEKITDAYMLSGESRSGVFNSTGTGDNSSITLPPEAAIPNGSPVLITDVNSL